MHSAGVVHRDIKPANIFVADDERLVLGDLGIVFFEDRAGDRITETFERVGTRDWMPHWAHTGTRVDDVKPSFDVFSLAKVLWSMLSGQPFLPLWNWHKERYDLTKLFPEVFGMHLVNQIILSACVVQEEEDCLPNAEELVARVDHVLNSLPFAGQSVGEGMRCLVCGLGTYDLCWPDRPDRLVAIREVPKPGFQLNPVASFNPENVLDVRAYRCSQCGHVALFQFPERNPMPAWKGPRLKRNS